MVSQKVRSNALHQDLKDEIAQFVASIRKRYLSEWLNGASSFKICVLAEVRHQLPPFRGRPPDPVLDEVEQLRSTGATFDSIALGINPEYARWDRFRQRCYRESLRTALRKRRRRRMEKA
jgi:hypothetical protein